MSSKNENAVLEVIDYDDEDLSIEDLEASLEAELELQLADLALLEEEREIIGNPDNLGQVIMDEVWTQFGNQIGLDMTNETLIQAYNREHSEEYNKAIANAIMQDEKYKEANKAMKQQHQDGTLTDGYTGKTMEATDKPNLDHVVPRKELYDNVRRKQSGIDTKDLANKEENLVPTNESLNKSKKEKSNKQYVEEREQREETLKKKADAAHEKIDKSNNSEVEKRLEHEKVDKRLQDKLDADDKMMMDADAKARKAINKDIAVGVAKQTAKKAGKDALKAMAVSALFDLLKSIMNSLVRFFKEKHKSFKLFLTEMEESIAGYTQPMEKFFESNPGLKSRFNTFIEFPDYDADELENILLSVCKNNDYVLTDDVRTKIRTYLEDCTSKKDKNFANGRLARNLYDDLVMNHARRVSGIANPTIEDLLTIISDDFAFASRF